MHILEKDGMLAVYRDTELMLKAVQAPGLRYFMLDADYILKFVDNEKRYVKIIKDRSGVFNMEYNIEVKTALGVINYLYERDKNETKH